MKWLEVHIDTNHAGLEAVETMLSALGIDGVVIDDETEFEDFLENNRQCWDYVDEDLRREMRGKSRVTFYLAEGEKAAAKLGEVRIALSQLKRERPDTVERCVPGEHGGRRLGEQLEAVLPTPGDRGAAAGGAGVAAGHAGGAGSS